MNGSTYNPLNFDPMASPPKTPASAYSRQPGLGASTAHSASVTKTAPRLSGDGMRDSVTLWMQTAASPAASNAPPRPQRRRAARKVAGISATPDSAATTWETRCFQ